ncbi:hypothetical protein QJS04_geneDACA014693 [Acorus gramineus]|uniref:Uncharacterized protein n=1 Tax=Acorus gramineus TaxID=55184 RepID=A0AAV9B3H6_ACOGR|nr:hypothetical protein QJS04_geneDACA014693 [Acorus gramineus]
MQSTLYYGMPDQALHQAYLSTHSSHASFNAEVPQVFARAVPWYVAPVACRHGYEACEDWKARERSILSPIPATVWSINKRMYPCRIYVESIA